MRRFIRLAVGAGAIVGLSTLVAPVVAGADPPGPSFFGGADHVVFVQTDNTAGNQVVAYDRSDNGSLTLAGTYNTGGLGGQLTGSVVDHLASQGSLTYDQRDAELYAVNAGSNTVSVFSVQRDHLFLRQVVNSGGAFPVSVAVNGSLVYVLNAENGGSVQGYVNFFGHLFAIPGSNRALGLDPTATPQFTNTPGQVAFSPDGSKLIVTTKANGSDIDVFGVGRFGLSVLGAGGELRAWSRAVRGLLRRGGTPRRRRGGHQRIGHLRPQPGRHGDPDRHGRYRSVSDVLGCPSAGVLLRVQRRKRLGEPVFGVVRRCTCPGRTDDDRPGHG